MRSLYSITVFTFISLVIITSCTKKKILILSVQDKIQWQKDSSGCLGFRDKFIKAGFNKKDFIGKNYNFFVENFGNASLTKSSARNVSHIFWITCNEVPDVLQPDGSYIKNNKQFNTEATTMEVVTDNNGIIREIGIQIP